jgi:hypothetical protein
MRPLGLTCLVPSCLRAGKWLVVLVCYLDDSGKDPQNRITTVAGFVAKDTEWEQFEIAVEPIFGEYGVKILHAKDLHHTEGEFSGWTVLKKQTFVYKVCKELSPRVPLGVSMSALKGRYQEVAAASGRRRTVTPYSFCVNGIIDWILRDVRVGREAHADGLSLILECGHENNAEAEQLFYAVRKQHGLENVLRSISFVPKDNCRAIQMADLIAFFTRRHGAQLENPPKNPKPQIVPAMVDIIAGAVPIRNFVATDFEP